MNLRRIIQTIAFFSLSVGLLAARSAFAVDIFPGTNIQSVVDANPAGTTYVLKSGLFRLQSVQVKAGDTYIGEAGTILNGSNLITSFTNETISGVTYWVAPGPSTPGQQNGFCDGNHPACTYPEDFYIDDKPLLRVAAISSVASGACYFDYTRSKIYFADNPTGHKVEVSSARSAFWGSASGVTIQNLVIEKYAIPAQMGAIGDQYPGDNWKVIGNETRLNHGVGITASNGAQILNNFTHDNGEKGIGATGNNILIQGNEISGNNYAGFDCGWECGGLKAAVVNGLTVQNNHVHDNNGPGLWDDINAINVLYTGNYVHNNVGPGIFHEIGYDTVISSNTCAFNGTPIVWWNGQIQLSTSQNTQVFNNRLFASATSGNLLSIIQQNRGTGSNGVYATVNNSIHDNAMTDTGLYEAIYVAGDYNQSTELTSNTIDHNHYHVADITGQHNWVYGSGNYSNFAQWQADGEDVHGTADTNVAGAACDVNNDGLTNISDIQLEINMALHVSPCNSLSGQCSILQVQRVINSALGQSCITP